jgi:hypothetical protein
MADYVYVGRSRQPWKVALYQALTLGVYGRVWLYKQLHDFDGHEALFLDRRPYLPLLILPFIGPFFVKRRVAHLLEETLHHDVTSPHFRRRRAVGFGLIPLVPVFHLYLQKFINHHWKMHMKTEELKIKQAQLAALQKRGRTAENLALARELEKDVAVREKELQDLHSAAIALREADEIRRAGEREGAIKRSRFAAVAKLGSVAKFRRRGAPGQEATPEQVIEESEPTTAETAKGVAPKRRGRAKETEATLEEDKEPRPTEEPAEEELPKKGLSSLLGRFKRPAMPTAELDAEDPKVIRKLAKEERKAAKAAAKEARRKSKDQRKADKAAAKQARRDEKERLKDQKRKAKEAQREAKKSGEGKKKGAAKGRSKPAKAAPKAKKPGKKK